MGGASDPSGLSRRPQHRPYPHRATPLWVADGAMCIRCDPQGVEVKTLICPQVIAAVAARPVDQPLQAIPRPRQGVALIALLVSATPWRGRLP